MSSAHLCDVNKVGWEVSSIVVASHYSGLYIRRLMAVLRGFLGTIVRAKKNSYFIMVPFNENNRDTRANIGGNVANTPKANYARLKAYHNALLC